MIFLFVMPMSAAFFNYLIPLMIGARDVAFPRLNAYSFWVFLFGGLFLYSSFFLGGAPNGGWFGYAPNSTTDPVDRHDLLRARAADHRHRVDRRRGEPRRHGHQHARAGHDAVPHAGLRVDGPRGAVPAGLRAADHHGRRCSSCCSTGGWHGLLRPDARRRPDPVAAPVLAVRPPRGLHPDPAGVRHHQRDPAGLQPQAAVRLPVRGVLGHRDRLHRVRRVGAPHVRGGPRARSRTRRSASRRRSSRSPPA